MDRREMIRRLLLGMGDDEFVGDGNVEPDLPSVMLPDDVEDTSCTSNQKIAKEELLTSPVSLSELIDLRKQFGTRLTPSFDVQCTERLLPNTVLNMQLIGAYRDFDSRVYNGQFTADGNCFYGSSQSHVLIYDTSDPYRWERSRITSGRAIRWTITDIDVSPCQKFLIYSTIDSHVDLVNLYPDEEDNLYSAQADQSGNLYRSFELADGDVQGFGIWSVKFSGDGREIVAGTTKQTIEVYDMMRAETVYRVQDAHRDDINTVCFANRDYSDVIYTGSDDSTVKVWDRRTLSQSNIPEGVFIGHREGVTHVSSKGDGIYLISNGKDQTLKLWDTRKMTSQHAADEFMSTHNYISGYDYRWGQYPARNYTRRLAADNSVQTFRGHQVLSTLIRCYFSPLRTTAQRYIVTGSADGRVVMYDTISGKTVTELSTDDGHADANSAPVRDVSWHPVLPMIAATSFGGEVCVFAHRVKELED